MRLLLFYFIFNTVTMLQAQSLQYAKQSGLHYLVKKPATLTKKTPVIFLLHGVGSNEEDLFSFANQLPSQFLVISVRAPYTLGLGSYAWYHIDFSTGKLIFDSNEELQSRKKLISFIEELKTTYDFDEKAIYLCGFSQGAIMSYGIGLTHPSLVKGMMIMSGRLLEEVKPSIVKTETLTHLKIFISHGTSDPVLPIDNARSANAYLKTLGLMPDYHEYKDVHTINSDMFKDLLNWLSKK